MLKPFERGEYSRKTAGGGAKTTFSMAAETAAETAATAMESTSALVSITLPEFSDDIGHLKMEKS